MKKRIFCLALALLMLVGMLPVSSFAEGFTPDPPECDKGCNQTSVGAHQDQCAVKEYYREIYRAYTAQELYDMKDILGEDAWKFILGASWSLDNAKAQELNTLIQNGGPTTPENPCKCCENCTGAEDCECGCGECDFCEPSTPENPCKCCENCTGAEDCECGCGNCQFCEPEEPTIPEVSDGNVIASGNLGEGAKLTVSAGSADKAEAFTSILSDLEDVNIFNQYVYDIDLSGSFEGSVELSVSGIPSAGSNERLLVIHLLDSAAAIEKARAAGTLQTYTGENLHLIYPEETAASGDNNTIYYEEISARRVAGNVTFSTSSFSEFIIYTVDFHYNGFEFSIPGGSGIYLSELFDRIGIERSVADVSSVTFTNYDLLSVVEDGDDWLLTSLRPFTSEEVLTILFSDGMEIAIAVTDASYDSSLYIFAFCANDTDIPSVDKGYTNIENDKSANKYDWTIHNNIIGGDGVITLENTNKKTVTAYAQKPGRVEIRGNRTSIIGTKSYTTFQVFVFRSEDHFAFCGSKEAQAVSVRVVDKNGKIVTGVPVTISSSGASYTAKTDEFGYAWFFNLPGETTYTVNVAEFKASDGHWYTASSSVTTPKAKDNIFESGSFHISQSTPSYSYVSEYSIVYHANDGSGETMTDSEHVKSGGQVTVDANSFSRDGYTFGGWYGSSDGTGKNYAVGSKATLTADLNVYVKWNPISYVVSFDVVGATSGAIANKTYTFDTRYTLPTPEKKYTVTYNHNDAADHGGTAVTSTADAAVTFDGWMDQGAITFKGKSYSYQGLGAERTKFDAPFYANPNKSSDVYKAVGNHYNKYGLVKHFFEYGINEYYNQNSEIRKPAPTSDLEKPGVYPGGAEVSNLSTTANAIVSLVARWSAAETLTLPTLTRTDYNFAGWYSDAALTNYVGDAGDPYTPTGDAELYAKWNPKTYGVTYKYTGTVPTGAPNAPVDTNSYTSGSSVTVKPAPTPAPAGYAFSGWSKTGSFTITGNTEITGSWSPINYTISYNLNGGTNNAQNPTSYNVTSPLITLKDPTPPAGYTFGGWAEGNTIPSGSTGNKTFTAIWTGNPYYLTFYFNGGNDGTVSSGPFDAQMGTGRFCEVTWLNPNREGYDFAGWFDAKTGGTQVYYGATDQAQDASKVSGWYIPGTKYWNTSSQWIYTNNLDLYAHWTPKTDATYTVHYYKEGTTEIVQNDKVVNGATFDQVYSETAPETIGNYTLVGAKTQSVTAGYSNNVITFYYKQNASYSVTYQYTGEIPDGANALLPVETTEHVGDSVTVADAPSLTGYTFSGWTTDDATVTDGKFTMPAKAVTFTGSWSVNQYTVTYQYADDKTTDKTVSYSIEDQVTLEDKPTRDGYVFSKWKLATAPNTTWTTGEYDAKQGFNAGKYGNVTFVAQWKKIHTVTWMNGTTVLETDKVVDGESASFDGKEPTKEKAGYECTFAYWFNDTDGNPLNDTTIQNVTKDLEIVARFDEKVVPYAITYDLAGGELPAGVTSNVKNYTFNDSVTLMKAPTKDGYRFTGWLLSEALVNPVGYWPAGTYAASQSFNPGRYGNITLVAQWERQTGNLVLDYVGDGAPAIVNVSGEGLNINLVISADKTIVNLPTGDYTVTAQSGNASYSASVDPSGANNAEVTADTANPATVEVTVASRGLKWFTGFHRMTNRCS